MGEDAATKQPVLELHFELSALTHYGLPDIGYPLPAELLSATLDRGGELLFGQMLYQLQVQAERGEADWRGLEPAMARLAELIAPDDEREVVTAAGPDWWLEIGPVDLEAPIVTIQREQELVAAISKREDGRLRAAAYRPLDGGSARLLMDIGFPPHPEHGVCMRENNWEYALDCSAGTGWWYAHERGEAYLSNWPSGIGRMNDGRVNSHWREKRALPPRRPPTVAVELGVTFAFSPA